MTAKTNLVAAAAEAEAELQAALARHALSGFDALLAFVPPDTPLPSHQVGAIVRLIKQAEDAGLVA